MSDRKVLQVGITGGIGSGKSVVAKVFELCNVPVYESDDAAKQLYFDPEVKRQVIQLLGPEIYLSDQSINREAIASRIYTNPALRTALNLILHPAVARHYADWVARQRHPYVLKVAALLFEADIYKMLDVNILVVSPAQLKMERIKKRDPFRSESQILQIMESQMSDAQKIPLADGLIHNDEKQSIIAQVWEWNEKILARTGK